MKKCFCLFLCFTLCACAAVTPRQQTITVVANHPDAVITVNGEVAGIGNVQKSVKRNKQVDIVAYKDGYISAHKSIGKHNNVQAILDAATCGFGMIIFALPWCISAFASPGAWSLDETHVSLFLQQVK